MRRDSTPGSDQPGDRAKAGAALERHPKPSTHPVDILLIVDRDNGPRPAGLGKEAVEAVKRAHAEHATARKPIHHRTPPQQPGPAVTISTDLTARVAHTVSADFSHYPGAGFGSEAYAGPGLRHERGSRHGAHTVVRRRAA